ENFQKGVHEYLLAHAYGNATASDFLRDVGAHSGKPTEFAPVFSSFLDQPGVPLVTAELSCEKNAPPKLLLTQERYLPQASAGTRRATARAPHGARAVHAGGCRSGHSFPVARAALPWHRRWVGDGLAPRRPRLGLAPCRDRRATTASPTRAISCRSSSSRTR